MPDIDYGEILEALNDKVDLSGSWSAPTSTYDNLTISAGTETYFTAPADGWFCARCAGTGGWLEVRNNTSGALGMSFTAPSYGTAFSFAKKGDQVVILISGSVDRCRFIYAQKTN